MPIQSKQQPPYYTQESTAIKEYTALLTANGTSAPDVIVLTNNIGNITWTRQGQGNYYGTLANTFPLQKTTIFITSNNGRYCFNAGSNEDEEPSNSIFVNTYDVVTELNTDNGLYFTPITIKIYQ